MLNSRGGELKEWFKGEQKEKIILDILVPKNTCDAIFFIELKDMNTLETDFGKKHQNKGAGYIVIYGFSQRDDTQKDFEKFHSCVAKSLEKNFQLKRLPQLISIAQINEKFEKLSKKKNSTPPIPEDLVPTLELLKDSKFRNTIIRAKQAKNPTFDNIVKSTGMDESIVQTLLTTAVDSNILIKQYNVLCPSCKNPLARVSTQSTISRMVKDGVSCPLCKVGIKDTSYANCYLVKNNIGSLLEGSKWMGMYVRMKLEPFLLKCLTSVIDGPNELDLVANVDGSLLLMELKDARFDIGHAYSFVGKNSQYHPDIAMIVATDGVSEEVREYSNNTGITTNYVEKLTDLEQALKMLFSEKNAQRLGQLLGEVSWNKLVAKGIFSSFDVEVPFLEDRYSFKFGPRPYWTVE